VSQFCECRFDPREYWGSPEPGEYLLGLRQMLKRKCGLFSITNTDSHGRRVFFENAISFS
jgi:hypothetical protein